MGQALDKPDLPDEPADTPEVPRESPPEEEPAEGAEDSMAEVKEDFDEGEGHDSGEARGGSGSW